MYYSLDMCLLNIFQHYIRCFLSNVKVLFGSDISWESLHWNIHLNNWVKFLCFIKLEMHLLVNLMAFLQSYIQSAVRFRLYIKEILRPFWPITFPGHIYGPLLFYWTDGYWDAQLDGLKNSHSIYHVSVLRTGCPHTQLPARFLNWYFNQWLYTWVNLCSGGPTQSHCHDYTEFDITYINIYQYCMGIARIEHHHITQALHLPISVQAIWNYFFLSSSKILNFWNDHRKNIFNYLLKRDTLTH